MFYAFESGQNSVTSVTGKHVFCVFYRDEKWRLNHHDHVETTGWPVLIGWFTLPSVGESGSLEKAATAIQATIYYETEKWTHDWQQGQKTINMICYGNVAMICNKWYLKLWRSSTGYCPVLAWLPRSWSFFEHHVGKQQQQQQQHSCSWKHILLHFLLLHRHSEQG